MSSRSSMLLPCPELDGNYDPAIHLTPTRSTADLATISMKFAFPNNNNKSRTDDDDMILEDRSSYQAGGIHADEEYSPPPLMGRNPPNDLSSPTSMSAFRMPSMDDSSFTPPSIPAARTGGTIHSIISPPSRDEPHSMLAANTHGRQPMPFSTGRDSINNVSSSIGSTSSNNNDVPNKRRRGRHVRSSFVFDGNNFAGSVTKPGVVSGRATTAPVDGTMGLFGSTTADTTESQTSRSNNDPWYRQSTC